MKKRQLFVAVLIFVGVAGCAGRGERIDLAIPGMWTVATAAPTASSTGPRLAVLPFEDQRVNQSRLGQRDHFWGGHSFFELLDGPVSTATAQALVDYLNRRGWRASVAKAPGGDSADVTIADAITDLSIDARGRFMRTDLSAKSSLAFQITNHSDDTIVRERVSGAATDQVFWFTPDDAQKLLSELLESNFQKLMNDLQIDGRAIRFK